MRVRPLPIAFVVILALLLVPHVLYTQQPYFMDEGPILLNVIEFLSERTVIPVHAKYPTLFSYLAAPFVALGVAFRWAFGEWNSIHDVVGWMLLVEPLGLALPARLLSLTLLGLSGGALFVFLRPRLGHCAGAFAFVLVLASPAFLQYGSYGLPDVAVFFFCVMSLLCVAAHVEDLKTDRSIRYLVLSSVFAGLAMSTKYNAASAIVPISACILFRYSSGQWGSARASLMTVASAGAFLGAFLVGSPGWILDFELFSSELLYEVRHATGGHLGFDGIPILGNIELLATEAPVIFIWGFAGFILSFWKGRPGLWWVSSIAVLASIGLSAISSKQSLHYLYPGFAGLLLLGSFVASELEQRNQRVAVIVVGMMALVLGGQNFGHAKRFLQPNTTELARQWMYDNVSEGSQVAPDWAYVPKVFSGDQIARVERVRDWASQRWHISMSKHMRSHYRPYEIVELEYSVDWLSNTDAEYLITSTSAYSRFFTNGTFTRTTPEPSNPLGREFSSRRAFYSSLFNSAIWYEVYSVHTDNGPRTTVFRKQS